MSATIDISALCLGEVYTSAKGAKSVPICFSGRGLEPVQWTPEEFQQVAFEPTAFNGEDVARVNLVMVATPEVNDFLAELDERLITLATENSNRIFGKQLTNIEVSGRYTSSIKVSEKGYQPTFRAKINLSGRGAVQCWDMEKTKREKPEAWIQCKVQPKIILKSLWLMGKQFGALYECGNVLIDEVGQQCPF